MAEVDSLAAVAATAAAHPHHTSTPPIAAVVVVPATHHPEEAMIHPAVEVEVVVDEEAPVVDQHGEVEVEHL